MKQKKQKRRYVVNIDKTWSSDVYVTATSEREAKKLAWQKFAAKKPVRSHFSIYADKL